MTGTDLRLPMLFAIGAVVGLSYFSTHPMNRESREHASIPNGVRLADRAGWRPTGELGSYESMASQERDPDLRGEENRNLFGDTNLPGYCD